MPLRYSLLNLSLVAALGASTASAQPSLERIVGPGEYGAPVTISAVDGQQLAILGKAAGVSTGFEGTWPVRQGLSIPATKRPLHAVLDEMVQADPRYEWREDNEVIVMRPRASWDGAASPLHAPVGKLTLDNISAGDALSVLAQMVGASSPSSGVDSRRFSVDVPEGAAWIEALNAIVRAHGRLSWAIEYSSPFNPDFPLLIKLNVGVSGVGIGIRAGAVLHPTIVRPPAAVDTTGTELTILDRIIRTDVNGPLSRAYAPSGHLVSLLATAVRVPMGFESAPPGERLGFSESVNLIGMTLGDALNTLVARDPRYVWQDVHGVIVLRPIRAWLDYQHPLLQSVSATRLQDVPTGPCQRL
jgi:hypothetical protein